VIKFVSDLRQVGGFLLVLRFPPPIKNYHHDITEIFLKGTLNTTPYPNLVAKWLRVLALSVVDSRFDLPTGHIKDISAKDNQGGR